MGDLALPDCALFLWTVSCHLDQAIEVGRAWGFAYKAIVFVWIKTYQKSGGVCFGLGKWTRLGAERVRLNSQGWST